MLKDKEKFARLFLNFYLFIGIKKEYKIMGISYISYTEWLKLETDTSIWEVVYDGTYSVQYEINGLRFKRDFSVVVYYVTKKLFYLECIDKEKKVSYAFKITNTDRRKIFQDYGDVIDGALNLFCHFAQRHKESIHYGKKNI